MPQGSAANTPTFSIKHNRLVLRNTRQCFQDCVKTILNREMTTESTKTQKRQKIDRKAHLGHKMRVETRRQSPCLISTENGPHRCSATPCTSANDHTSSVSADLGVTEKLQQDGKFTNAESANNEH